MILRLALPAARAPTAPTAMSAKAAAPLLPSLRFRPAFSQKPSFQQHRQPARCQSYSTAVPTSHLQQQQQQQLPTSGRRWVRTSTLVFLLLGAGFAFPAYGRVAKLTPTLPEPGSPAEDKACAVLETRAAELPIVAELTTDPKWLEWTVGSRWVQGGETSKGTAADSSNNSTSDTSADPPRRKRLTHDALGGARGMTGYHRVFLNQETGEIISVVHLGGALSGFPTRAHGGALATLLDEALGRCAIHTLPARTGVTARLELQYRRPVPVPGFYIVRCRPELPEPASASASASAPKASQELRKLWCSATLETPGGHTCVEARGLFVVPRGYKLGRVEDRF